MAYYKKTPNIEASKKHLTVQGMKSHDYIQGNQKSVEMLDTSIIEA
jgi:hypothetical protein